MTTAFLWEGSKKKKKTAGKFSSVAHAQSPYWFAPFEDVTLKNPLSDYSLLSSCHRLDYQPLFGKWAHAPPLNSLFSGRTERAAQIEPSHGDEFKKSEIKRFFHRSAALIARELWYEWRRLLFPGDFRVLEQRRFEATHFNQKWTFSFLGNGSAGIFGQLTFCKSQDT